MTTPPIPFASVTRTDRVRKDYGNIESLAEDLYVNGFIHPLCISHDNQLIAGGRRSAALDHIIEHFTTMQDLTPHESMARFLETGLLEFGIHYTHKQVDSLAQLAEYELIENVQRHNFSWQEEVLAVARVHKLRTDSNALQSSKWTQQQTGRLLGVSRANVAYCLDLARHLRDDDSPIWKCTGVVDAMQYLAKLEHDKASQHLAAQVKQRASTLPTTNITPTSDATLTSFIQSFNPAVFTPDTIQSPANEFGEAPPPIRSMPTIVPDHSAVEEAMQVATKMVHNLDALEFFKMLGKESVDHVITDPPYGIDMKMLSQTNQGQADIDRIEDTHDVAQNMSDFPLWLQGCYDILKPKGFCVWFCDQAQWQYLFDLATGIGFKVQRWPFVWVKTSSCSNQRAEFNFTKSTEIAMVMRKEGGRLVKQQPNNYFMGGLTPDDKAACVNHPFAKPEELWLRILSAVALPGSTIAEPFSGVGSGTRAMMKAGYMPVAGELDPAHYAQQVSNIANEYLKLKGAGK